MTNIMNFPRSVKIAFALNSIDYFLFIAYGFLGTPIGKDFFGSDVEEHSLTAGLILFLVGFLSRPLGALVFGRLGDLLGRRLALKITFITTLLAVSAVIICPPYAQIGYWATACIVISRLLHGMTHGAHNFGVVVYVIEQSEGKRKNWLCGVLTGSSYAGILCSSLIIALLTKLEIANYWRYVFGFGVLAGLPLIYAFKYLPETNAFIKENSTHQAKSLPWFEYLPSFLKSFLLTAASLAPFYVISTYVIRRYYVESYQLNHYQIEIINALFVATLMIFIPIFGYWVDRLKPVKVMVYALSLSAILAISSYLQILIGSPILLLTANIILITIAYAAFVSTFIRFQAELFPVKYRLTLLALSGNIGSILFGGAMPLLAEHLTQTTRMPGVSFFIIAICALSGVLVLLWKPEHNTHTSSDLSGSLPPQR